MAIMGKKSRRNKASGGGTAGNRGRGRNNAVVRFLYKGQPNTAIPRDVTHARIDPSIMVIGEGAFALCEQLVDVELCEGLEGTRRNWT